MVKQSDWSAKILALNTRKRIGHWPDYFTLCMWKLSGKMYYCKCRGWSTHVLCEYNLFGSLQRGRERSQRLVQMQRVQQKRNHLESIWWRPTKTHGLKIPGTVGTILKRMSFHLQERLLPSLWRNQPERRFCILQVRRRTETFIQLENCLWGRGRDWYSVMRMTS